MPEHPRVLVVGLDAADPGIVMSMARAERMPTIAELSGAGAAVPVEHPPGLYVKTLWPTMFTGRSPAEHGVSTSRPLAPGTYRTTDAPLEELSAKPFWEHLGEGGMRVGVVDVPFTTVSEGLNGIHVVDWGAHDPYRGLLTWPRSVASNIRERFGDHPVAHRCEAKRDVAQLQEYRDQLLAGVETKAAIAEHLLALEPWDLFMLVFSESHCAGHQCWHLHDDSHPRSDPQVTESVGDVVEQTYTALDAALGRLLRRFAGPETTVMVFLSHGMGPHYDGTHLLELFLRRLERKDRPALRRGRARLAERAWDRVPWPARNRFLRRWDDCWRGGYRNLLPRDPARRRWFQAPGGDAHAALRLNVAGREPEGKVAPAEYDAECDMLTRELEALVNLDTGRRAVNGVIKTADRYAGAHVDRLPDLLVQWSREAPIRRLWSPTVGLVTDRWTEMRTGDHLPDSLLLVAGPGIRAGETSPVAVESIAPTIAALLGVGLPDVAAPSIIDLTVPSDEALPATTS